MIKKINLTLICFVFAFANTYSQDTSKIKEEIVIAQMNYCITTLTNIIHNRSMAVLEHESDQLLNNLAMEPMIGLYEINDFRVELLDAIKSFEITEEERALLKRLQSMKRDNLKWTALSNAINPAMLLIGSNRSMMIQGAFQALLTSARSTIGYKAISLEEQEKELEALWELRKKDLEVINNIRIDALKIVFNLYGKYNLSENDRLTEDTANKFSTYTSEPDAARRVRLLEGSRDTYGKLASYYYHLGMAYIDLNDYDKAKTNFSIYLDLYEKAPILRYDEMSGCIALTRLAYEKDLSSTDKKHLINIALKNLPNNSAAVLQCAMIYIYELDDIVSGLELIRSGLDDPNASDKEILYLAAANLMPVINKYPQLKEDISSSFKTGNDISVNSYLIYLMNSKNNCWNDISKLLEFRDVSSRDWSHLGIGTDLNENLHIVLLSNLIYEPGDLYLYMETHNDKGVEIQEINPELANSVSIDDIERVDCFKENKNLMYLFFNVIVPDKVFTVKENIDYTKIKSGEYHRMSEFILSDGDIKEIIKFCKMHDYNQQEIDLICNKTDNGDKSEHTLADGATMKFSGDSLRYQAYHSKKQSGYYLRMVFSNGINIIYKYNPEDRNMSPYLYSLKDNIVFANNEVKEEYLCTVPPVEEPSIMSKMKTSVNEAGAKVGSFVKNIFSGKENTDNE